MKDSSSLSIVVPTIAGRENWLEKCLNGYYKTAPLAEVIVRTDAPNCGTAWIEGAELATREYVHFTADDITPVAGWWLPAMLCIDAGLVPAANVRDQKDRPSRCDSPLGDYGLLPNVLVPFLSQDMLAMGNWLLPFHYGTDDWVTYRAAQLGYEVRRCAEYKMVHHVASEGRNYRRRHGDVKLLVEAMEKAGYVPPVYKQLEIRLCSSATGLDSVSLSTLSRKDRDQQNEQEILVIRDWGPK